MSGWARPVPSAADRVASATRGRHGFSLVEVLVALLILALGVSLSVRVLSLAGRSLDEAELGLQALVLLSELVEDGGTAASEIEPRPAGPGTLVPEPDTIGAPAVRYEPPASPGGPDRDGLPGPGPYARPHEWGIAVGG